VESEKGPVIYWRMRRRGEVSWIITCKIMKLDTLPEVMPYAKIYFR
jgi:hypothetical protein